MTAMWLAIVAPVISQTVAVEDMSPMSSACDAHRDPSSPASPHISSMEKCGYCGLLSHHPVLPGVMPVVQVLPTPTNSIATTGNVLATGPSVLAADARGPPVFSQR
jgi:nitrous oxide reductase accessory protein NosL